LLKLPGSFVVQDFVTPFSLQKGMEVGWQEHCN